MADTIKLAAKGVVLAKVETNYGSDPTPAPETNAIRVEDVKIEPVLKKMTRNYFVPYMGAREVVNIGEALKLTFKTEVKGSGVAGTPPEIGVLYRGCNFTETVTQATKVDYDPNSLMDSAESLTLYFYLDGILHKLLGARGNLNLEAKAGEYGYLSWEFLGIFGGPTDAANPTQTLNATQPARFVSASFSYASYAAVIESLKVSSGNDVVKRPSANAATGVLQYFTKARRMTASIDPEVVALATRSWWGDLAASSLSAITATFGTVAGNKMIFTAAHAQLDDLKYGEREGILTQDVPLVLIPTSAGNDEAKFSFL